MKNNALSLHTVPDQSNHQANMAMIALLVFLAHWWLVSRLMQPSEAEKVTLRTKVMEVVLVSKDEPKPEPKAAPPAPAPLSPTPKKELPQKKIVKPVVKKKEKVIHEKGDIAAPKMVSKTPPNLPSFTPPVFPTPKAPSISNPAPSAPKAVAKPTTKPADGKATGASSGVVPLVRVQPKYPPRAASRRLEGWVKVQFTVSAAGTVTNASVIGAQPPGIFDDAALDAIRQWKFKQKMVNGAAVSQQAVQTLRFKLLQ